MPVWNDDKKRYVEELIDATDLIPAEREERFRTALLNEIDLLTRAVNNLDKEDS